MIKIEKYEKSHKTQNKLPSVEKTSIATLSADNEQLKKKNKTIQQQVSVHFFFFLFIFINLKKKKYTNMMKEKSTMSEANNALKDENEKMKKEIENLKKQSANARTPELSAEKNVFASANTPAGESNNVENQKLKDEVKKLKEDISNTQKELSMKVSQTAQFNNMKKILVTKNNQIKEFRDKLNEFLNYFFNSVAYFLFILKQKLKKTFVSHFSDMKRENHHNLTKTKTFILFEIF